MSLIKKPLLKWINEVIYPHDVVHAIHIRKTGGTAIKSAINLRHAKFSYWKIRNYEHPTTFANILETDPKARILFVARDPAKRFVSGFNSRLRKAQPLRFIDWSPGERIAFEIFKTPNELAEALNSPDPVKKRDAEWSMKVMPHLAYDLTYWLKGVDYLEQHKSNIFYIAEMNTLNEDFEFVKSSLNIPGAVSLPGNDVAKHATPDEFSTELSELGLENLRIRYREDYELYEWCLRYREAMGWPTG